MLSSQMRCCPRPLVSCSSTGIASAFSTFSSPSTSRLSSSFLTHRWSRVPSFSSGNAGCLHSVVGKIASVPLLFMQQRRAINTKNMTKLGRHTHDDRDEKMLNTVGETTAGYAVTGAVIRQLPFLEDNYVFVAHFPRSGEGICVDPGDADVVLAGLKHWAWKLDYIFLTHHHSDHTGGVKKLKEITGCKVIGSALTKQHVPEIDIVLADNEEFTLPGSNTTVQCLFTPGHTLDHVSYWLKKQDIAFVGDTLFSMGCGRNFESPSSSTLFHSLQRLVNTLPPYTMVYAAHEYTADNMKFALAVNPRSPVLKERNDVIVKLRKQNVPTVPFQLFQELQYNPFLRCGELWLRADLKMTSRKDGKKYTDLDVFMKLRGEKDKFNSAAAPPLSIDGAQTTKDIVQ